MGQGRRGEGGIGRCWESWREVGPVGAAAERRMPLDDSALGHVEEAVVQRVCPLVEGAAPSHCQCALLWCREDAHEGLSSGLACLTAEHCLSPLPRLREQGHNHRKVCRANAMPAMRL